MAVDGSNNVIVTGYSDGSGSGLRLRDDQVFERGRAALDQPLQRAGERPDYAFAVAVDGSNDVIVTGIRLGAELIGDYATIKYSSAGVPLWTNRYNGPGNGDDCAYAVAVDGSNNVIVTGIHPAAEAITITRRSSIRARACRSGPTATTGRGMASTTPTPWRWTAANVIVTGYSDRQRKRLRLRDDQVFERGRAALDQPLQRAGERQ